MLVLIKFNFQAMHSAQTAIHIVRWLYYVSLYMCDDDDAALFCMLLRMFNRILSLFLEETQ